MCLQPAQHKGDGAMVDLLAEILSYRAQTKEAAALHLKSELIHYKALLFTSFTLLPP